ncbi:MAG: Phosphatidylserine decarboxylase (EC [uncultured Sulfurovum sp.]|uniref:phosphatidylserine decarboxylase n=1 Tax=uncultured Sulfurovum sp. TaxID=269237 RepID=A0A6S6T5Q6_9BACT|nr:MAG: Phosphatidylserine decarboxylase (EC [uncultured Sulfurovum sp.]
MKKHYSSLLSTGFGKFASKPFSKPLQKFINNSYVKLMGLDMTEFDTPANYPTLNKLFTRSFINKKEITTDENIMISPVDALVTDFGKITDGKAYQIKGMEYNITELFGEYHEKATKAVEGGEFVNLYLSPKDYHRYHTPDTLNIISLTHIPGKLYPVNFPLLRNKKNLFIENERVIIECTDKKGNTFIMVLVGALNVGKMVVTFEESINTNSDIREPRHYTYENLTLEKGALFGWFEMGSTILLFTQKDVYSPTLKINQKVKFTENIGTLN